MCEEDDHELPFGRQGDVMLTQKKRVPYCKTPQKMRTLSTVLLPTLALAQTSTTEETYYYFSSWIFLSLMLLFYFVIVGMTSPYARSRVPIGLFVLLIFFPPGFFILMLYLFILITILSPPPPPVVIVDNSRRRRMPVSRASMRR